MVRRRPLTPAAAMPHATLAWPQARPRGPCDAQPRAYHGPSDFRLWAPVGRTAHARNARLLGTPGRPCCCCRRRPAFRPRARASAGFQNARLAPASVEIPTPQTNTSYGSLYQQRIPTLFNTPNTLCSLRPLTRLARIVCDHMYRPPTACDRACRSLITCIAPGPRIPTRNIPTRFDTRTVCDHMCRFRRPPTACDRACRSLITCTCTCIAPRPRIPTKIYPTRFDTPRASPATTPRAARA